ncbi:MAG: serine/threonine protein kinase [Akkermansiaceae bacterium]|nr:serine/threonine protein kinase [Akkermansiaceae bacterium]
MTESEREELVAELAESFLARLRAGESVTIDSFLAEHAEVADDLAELLPAMVDMEGLSRHTQPPAPAMAHYPERLGDYHLLERIGSGGMGTVFRARQESLHREVAVKILAPSWNSDPRHSEAFENESRVIAALRHTNIVEVFGAGQEGHYRYYVMGLVNGKGVSAGRLGAAFPGMPYERAVATVGLQAAKALAFAHKNGVVHRDVKPGNLLLDNSGVLQVSDFGLATILNNGEDAPLVTQSHDGTLRYMAPERLLKGINSFAGDQYSLGLTLYELLAKRPVFRETEPGKLVQNICNGLLPPLKGYGELGAIINKASSYEATERYASMAEMAEDLQRYLNGEPVKARAASYWRRYVLWMRRRPAVAVWSHAAVVLVGLLFTSVSIGYARVSKALKNENEQRLLADRALLRENEQRALAEKNEQIADACLQRIFASMISSADEDGTVFTPSKADARLLLDLMPYYEQLAEQADSAKVMDAASILATIALKTGDYATAETYFRRVTQSAPTGSFSSVEATIGLAVAIAAQAEGKRAADESVNLLLALEQQVPSDADFETRLQLVRALQLAASYSARGGAFRRHAPLHRSHRLPVRSVGQEDRARAEREQLAVRTASLLQALWLEQPNNLQVQLRRVEMLLAAPYDEVVKLLAPHGETAASLLESILKQYPDSNDAAFMYVRMAALGQRPGQGAALGQVDYARAASYAQSLLADNPADSELIMLFLSVRDKYAMKLKQQGQPDSAAKENERTLAILSFLTERADFTPEMRERLVMLVAMHPQHEQGRTQQEQEIRTLLQNYDDARIKELQQRMQRLRSAPPGPRRRRPGRSVK